MKICRLQYLLIVGLTFSGVTTFLFPVFQASAQCGWLDPTCSPDQWNRPPITLPGSNPPSESCLAVMTYPKEYSWSVRNDKTYPQTFWLDGREYNLQAGRSLSFTSKVGNSSTNSCGGGTTYSEPVIEFDRFVGDREFTSKKITVGVTKYREFNFWRDDNTIKFSSGSPR
jgi:hypothetical protein